MPRIPLPLPLLGLRDEAPAGSTTATHYDAGENVCDYDHRSGRVALATRPGLVAVGAASAAPTLIHPVTRPLQRDAWAELTTTAQPLTIPAEVGDAWTVALEAPPIASAVGPLGNGYVLLASGIVVSTSPTGKKLATFAVPIPTNFVAVPSLGLDDEGRLYAMSAFARRIDDGTGLGRRGAGRLHRMVEVDGIWRTDGDATFEWRPQFFALDRGEILVTAQKPDDWDEAPEADGLAPDEKLFRLAAVTGTPFVAWDAPAATPTTGLDVNEDGDVYVSSAPNPSRVATGAAPGTISVGWIPREAIAATEGVNAAETLYAHYSALRAQALQGLGNGGAQATWIGGTHDPSDFADVLDVRRDLVTPGDGTERRPVFDHNGFSGVPAFIFNGARCFVSTTSAGFHEKTTAADRAGWSQGIFPNMRDAAGQGAHFTVCMLFRVDLVADAAVRYVFDQGDYSLTYEDDGAGDLDFVFTYPGGTSTLTLPLLTGRVVGFSFVHTGHGDANSAWYLHDAAVTYSATGLTVNIPRTLPRTVLGGYREMLAAQWVRSTIVAGGVGEGDEIGPGEPFLSSGRYEVDDVVWNRGRAWTCIAAHNSNDLTFEPGAGAAAATYWTVIAKLGLVGAFAESVTFLGATTTTPHDTANTTLLRQKVEGFITNAYGRGGILPPAHPYDATPPPGTGDHPFDASQGLNVAPGITAKYSRADGRVVWVNNLVSGAGVAAAPDGYLYTASLVSSASVGVSRVRRCKDEGATVRTSGTDTFTISDSTGDAWLGDRIQLTTDHYGDLYLPWVSSDSATIDGRTLRRYRTNALGGSTATFVYDLGDGFYPLVARPAGAQVDLVSIGGVSGPEFLYVVAIDPTPEAPAWEVRRVDVLGRAETSELRSREVQTLSFGVDGSISRRTDAGAFTTLAAAGTLGTDRPWAVNVTGKVYIGGAGTPYKVYDPLLGTLAAWEAEGRSARPPRMVLGTRWRNRIIGVSVDDPHVMHASGVRRPLDWDIAPLVVTATQAFAGTSAASGNSPEPITALMPWADDLLLMGSAEGLTRVTGDPATGGQLDDVAAQDGVAYGYAWCRGPGETLYWLSSRGRLVRATPGGGLSVISAGAVARRLQEIDLTKYRVELAWSHIPEGVFVFLYRLDGTAEYDVPHYFVSASTGGWHPLRFAGGTERTLTAAAFVSSDKPVNSGLVLGFADGALRRFDREAWDDDGEPVRWHCRIPVSTNAQPGETIITDAELVTSEFGGVVRVGGLASRTANAPGQPMSLVDSTPGRGDLVPIQVAGPYTWLWLEGTEPSAVYDLAVYTSGGGSKR